MDIYPKPPVTVEADLRPVNKQKRWRRVGAASVATLLSAGAVIGVASAEIDNSSKSAQAVLAANTVKEFEQKWQAQKTINQEAKWFKHVHDQAVEGGLEFATAVASLAVKITESHKSHIPPTSSASSVSGTSYNGNVDAFLACTRGHESDSAGGYQAVSPDGVYFGAYQFDIPTWNSVAASNGRPDLVGVDPAQASPADQDLLATDLYKERGNQPWGGRC